MLELQIEDYYISHMIYFGKVVVLICRSKRQSWEVLNRPSKCHPFLTKVEFEAGFFCG